EPRRGRRRFDGTGRHSSAHRAGAAHGRARRSRRRRGALPARARAKAGQRRGVDRPRRDGAPKERSAARGRVLRARAPPEPELRARAGRRRGSALASGTEEDGARVLSPRPSPRQSRLPLRAARGSSDRRGRGHRGEPAGHASHRRAHGDVDAHEPGNGARIGRGDDARAGTDRVRRLLALLLLVAACTPRPRHSIDGDDTPEPKPGEPRVIEIDLSQGAPESSGDRILSLPAARTYTGLVRTLERALDSEETAGVFVTLGQRSLDFARAEELGRLLARFREKKRAVVCHAHTYSNASALLALSGCGRIWISAAGSVEAVGLVAQLVHVRGLLDKLKVEA